MALTLKQQKFIDNYLGVSNGNATDAARRAGFAEPKVQGSRLLTFVNVREEVDRRYREECMGADEVLKRLADQAKGPGEYFGTLDSGRAYVDVEKLIADGKGHLIKSVKYTNKGACIVEFHDAQTALSQIGRHHELFTDRSKTDVNVNLDNARETLDGKLAQLAARTGEAGVPR